MESQQQTTKQIRLILNQLRTYQIMIVAQGKRIFSYLTHPRLSDTISNHDNQFIALAELSPRLFSHSTKLVLGVTRNKLEIREIERIDQRIDQSENSLIMKSGIPDRKNDWRQMARILIYSIAP